MSKTVTVYSNPGCGPCVTTKRHLRRRGIEPVEENAAEHPDIIDLAKARGQSPVAPIVVVRDGAEVLDLWTEYRRDKIDALPA